MNGEEEEVQESGGQEAAAAGEDPAGEPSDPEGQTRNVTEEKSAGAGEAPQEDIPAAETDADEAQTGQETDPEGAGSPENSSEETDDAREQTGQGSQEKEIIPALNMEPEVSEIPWEYEDYEVNTRELKKKTPEKDRVRPREKAPERTVPRRPEPPAKPAADHAVFEDRSFQVSSVEELMFTQEKMQETVARGLRNLENYDTVLMQETDGQYAMVMQEDPKPDKQITGQLNLEEIMQEWEKVKRDFYESNGLEEDVPQEVLKVPEIRNTGQDSPGSMSTKSWDPGEVRKALQIKDDGDEKAGYDTSMFVTEGGGEFPREFAVEQMTLTTTDKSKVTKGQMYLHSEDSIRQLTDALGRIFLEGGRGNVVITDRPIGGPVYHQGEHAPRDPENAFRRADHRESFYDERRGRGGSVRHAGDAGAQYPDHHDRPQGRHGRVSERSPETAGDVPGEGGHRGAQCGYTPGLRQRVCRQAAV